MRIKETRVHRYRPNPKLRMTPALLLVCFFEEMLNKDGWKIEEDGWGNDFEVTASKDFFKIKFKADIEDREATDYRMKLFVTYDTDENDSETIGIWVGGNEKELKTDFEDLKNVIENFNEEIDSYSTQEF